MAQSDLVRGHLDMLLLALIAEQPSHGYALVEALRERSNTTFDLPEGTVYPALHRLESGGLIASSWSDAGGRRRRVYAITKRGRSVLKAKQQEWSSFVAAVQAVVRGAPWPATG